MDKREREKMTYKKERNTKGNRQEGNQKGNQNQERVSGKFHHATVDCSCGACQQFQEQGATLSGYKATVVAKQKRLVKELEQFTKVAPMITMEKPEYYKNRITRSFHHEKNGTPMSGFYNEFGRLEKVIECRIDDKEAQDIIDSLKSLLKSFKIKTYDKKSGYGLLKHVMIRKGVESGEIMVVLVLASSIMPSKNNFVKALRKLHPNIDTIVINENYKKPESVLGDKESNIYGKGFIVDTFAGKSFRISSRAHFPVNVEQSKKVYDTVLEWANLNGSQVVLDAYCGSGIGSVLLSDGAHKVISVDVKAEQVRDCISNVRRNGIKNVDVYKNDPTEFVKQVHESDKRGVDVAVINQPYMGCGKEFVDELLALEAASIIIVSRNPGSLAKELAWIVGAGYGVRNAVGVDVLPWTEQMEIVVQVIRK